MNSLEQLWEYQSAQLELEKYERQLKDTPTRKKLIKLQKYVQQSQAKLLEMENASKIMQNKLYELEKSLKVCEEDLEDLKKDFGYYSECDTDELNEKEISSALKACEATFEKMSGIKKQALSVKTQIDGADASSRELLVKMRGAKEEYDSLRVNHQKEIDTGKERDDELKKIMTDAGEGIDVVFMEDYNRTKGLKPNPVALFVDYTCKGCNMQLPSSLESIVVAAKTPVHCENCGRILYAPKK